MNVFISFLTIIIAAGVTGTLEPFTHVMLAAISASLITISANVINDYYDVEIDKINKPKRPLPSGKLSKKQALVYSLVVFIIAWTVAVSINIPMFLVAFLSGLLLILYSYKLKRTIIWGNLTVSVVTAMAFIYGGMAVHRAESAVYPAIFAFLFHFGREIIKDVQDVEGDQSQGAKTFPIRYGNRNALILTTLIFTLLIIITIIPYILNVYGIYYLLVVVFGVHTVLIYVVVYGWYKPTSTNLGRLSNLLKLDMLIGLLAIYVG